MIVILDYGLGNPISIRNMLKKCGELNVEITQSRERLEQADKIILPGVGNFESGISNLKKAPYFDQLNNLVLEKKVPVLGICLGMQLMTSFSEEGNVEGLNWIDAKTTKFKFENPDIKVPHMGWTDTKFINNNFENILFEEYPPRFYHVHSYFVTCNNQEDVLSEALYGDKVFHNGFLKENIMGVQFHPEKSHVFGQAFLNAFLNWKPQLN